MQHDVRCSLEASRLVPHSHSGPARRVEDRQIVVDARTGKLVAGKRGGFGMSLEQAAERLGK